MDLSFMSCVDCPRLTRHPSSGRHSSVVAIGGLTHEILSLTGRPNPYPYM
jgi:hypothetical protein